MYPRETLRRSLALYAVTDTAWLQGRTLQSCVEEALAGGATFVQLRDKNAGIDELLEQARELLSICHAAGVPFVVDDNVEVARLSGADGVHVGQSDMLLADARAALGPEALVGVSVSTVEQALAAQMDGADYVGVGAIFGTPTKQDASVIGVEGLSAIAAAVDIPVVAIGGLNAQTIPALAGSGADGVAVVSGIFAAEDIRAAASELLCITEETLCLKTK